MDIKQAVITCLRDKYFDFNGRAGKPEFWWFFLAQVIAMIVASVISDMLYWLVALGLIAPGLGVGARRLHDTGKSGWFQLLGLIPLLGFLVLVYFWIQPSAAANQYGAAPEAEPATPATVPPGAA
jgi:uncharacterized membrane protein YhaH (DUF805 family)